MILRRSSRSIVVAIVIRTRNAAGEAGHKEVVYCHVGRLRNSRWHGIGIVLPIVFQLN